MKNVPSITEDQADRMTGLLNQSEAVDRAVRSAMISAANSHASIESQMKAWWDEVLQGNRDAAVAYNPRTRQLEKVNGRAPLMVWKK